jgi:hypothetical protein
MPQNIKFKAGVLKIPTPSHEVCSSYVIKLCILNIFLKD